MKNVDKGMKSLKKYVPDECSCIEITNKAYFCVHRILIYVFPDKSRLVTTLVAYDPMRRVCEPDKSWNPSKDRICLGVDMKK